MKFTIEIEEFWNSEDNSNLDEMLVSSIKNDLIHEIKKHIYVRVEKEISEVVKEKVDSEIDSITMDAAKRFIDKKIVKERFTGKQISIDDYLNKQFSEKSIDLEKIVKNRVNEMSIKLAERYDMVFASQLISKMKDAGYLNEFAVKALVEK